MEVCEYEYEDDELYFTCCHRDCLNQLKPLFEKAKYIDISPSFDLRGYAMLRKIALSYISKLSESFKYLMYDFGLEAGDDEMVFKMKDLINPGSTRDVRIEDIILNEIPLEEDPKSPYMKVTHLDPVDPDALEEFII